jgi:atypical dual specificity phosphatase
MTHSENITIQKSPTTNYEKKEILSLFDYVNNFVKKCFKSPLFWTTVLALLGLGIGLFAGINITHLHSIGLNSIFLDISGVLLIGSIALSIIFKRELFLENSVFANSNFRDKVKSNWSYYSKIDDNIYLGALPLKNKGHIEELKNLAKKENKELAILTIVEPWELEEHLLSTPVTCEDWKKEKIDQQPISVIDGQPPALDQLKIAAKFIDDQIAKNKIVYVHCKAGRGRSAMAVAAYYLYKDEELSVSDVIKSIKAKRSVTKLDKKTRTKMLQDFKNKTAPQMRKENK